jgi:hypothetical protein
MVMRMDLGLTKVLLNSGPQQWRHRAESPGRKTFLELVARFAHWSSTSREPSELGRPAIDGPSASRWC